MYPDWLLIIVIFVCWNLIQLISRHIDRFVNSATGILLAFLSGVLLSITFISGALLTITLFMQIKILLFS